MKYESKKQFFAFNVYKNEVRKLSSLSLFNEAEEEDANQKRKKFSLRRGITDDQVARKVIQNLGSSIEQEPNPKQSFDKMVEEIRI